MAVAEHLGQHLPDVVGAVEDLGVGEAQRPQSGARMGLVAAQVDLLLGGGAVVAEAVGLDDEAELRPEEVDAIATEPPLGGGRGKSRVADDREEPALQRVLGAAEGLRVEDPLEAAEPGAARLAIQRRPQPMRADQVEPVRLVDRVFDLVVGQARRQVDQDRDRIPDGDSMNMALPLMSATMGIDPRSTPGSLAGNRYVNWAARPSANPPKLGSAVVAQLRPGTAGQYGRHQFTVAVNLPPPHRIYPPM
jgi:hypothetical protein